MQKSRPQTLLCNWISAAGLLASAATCAALTFSISNLLEHIAATPPSRDVFWYTLVGALLIAPAVETIIFQALPFKWLEKRRVSTPIKILAMSTPFALAHASKGWLAVLETQLGGLALAALYIHWQKVSSQKALLCVAVAHFLHNLLTAISIFSSGAKVILQ